MEERLPRSSHEPTTVETSGGPLAGRSGLTLVLVVYLAAATAFALRSPHSLFDFPLDDSWIHRVYARAFAHGEGFAYNPGQQETGATSPLWVIVTSPAHWLAPLGAHAPVVATKAVGVLFGALALAALYRTAIALGLSGLGATLAGLVLALEPRLHYSALSGMEVVLLLWLWLAALSATISRKPVAALALLGLAPLARPEAVLLVPLGVLAMAAVLGRERRSWPGAWAALPLVAPAALWGLFCRLVTGHWLPATFYVKAEATSFGTAQWRLGLDAVTQFGWGSQLAFPVGLAVAAAWLLRRGTGASRAALLLLLAVPPLYVAGVVGSREVFLHGFYWARWTDPAALVLTAAAGLGIGVLAASLPDLATARGSTRGALLAAGWGVSALAVVLALPGLATSFVERGDRLATDSRSVHLVNVAPALWIRENTPPEAVLGVNDAGATRYFGERRTIDMIGLNNADIAFGRPAANELSAEIDWVMVFPRVFRDQGLDRFFEIRRTFGIPYEEYTVCPCPGQNANVVAERR